MKTNFLTDLFDLISPRSCPICGERLTASESAICGICHLRMPLTNFANNPYDNPMARLFWGQFPIQKAAAYFYYLPQSDTSRLIYDMKYHHQPDLCENMGCLVAKEVDRHHFFEDINAIVPMPVTRQRQRQRGYNQSMEIARGISDAVSLPIFHKVIKRIHFDTSQTKMKGWERLENVENVFQLTAPETVKNKHLLLVDDIVTTGATVRACAQELCKADNVQISILSLGFTKK